MAYDVNEDGSIDRGENPKNPGDRGFGHGDQITLELVSEGENLADEVDAGYFVNFDGEGGVYRPVDADDEETPLEYHAVLKNSAEAGELVTVHVRGAVRTAEDPLENWPVITALDDDDYLIALR